MMSIQLTSDDVDRLSHTLSAVLTASHTPNPEAWTREVCTAIGRLIGSDSGYATFVRGCTAQLFSPDYADSVLSDYASRYPDFGQGVDLSSRQLQSKVYDRQRLWGKDLEWYYDSDYYHDFIVPNRAHDMIGLSAGRPNENHHSCVHLQFNRRDPRHPFTQKELVLLEMTWPAFESSAAALQWMPRAHYALGQLVDSLGVALALVDIEGNWMHRTPQLGALLSGGAIADLLAAALERVGAAVGKIARGPIQPIAPEVSEVVTIGNDAFRVRGSLLADGVLVTQPVAAITVEALGDVPLPDPTVLRELFGLTAREADVALLLARRRRNAEIAEALFISPHTARHHVERVLEKLGVNSRDGVRERLQRPC
jgi:DNA-binding CsgD family transcriptional regulator